MDTIKSKFFANPLMIGLALAGLFMVSTLALPHHTPRVQGTETDFCQGYFFQALEFHDLLRGNLRALSDPYWKQHGIGYAGVLLNGLGWAFPREVRGLNYFQAGKVISACAAASLIVLGFIILGVTGGILTCLVLCVNPVFLRLATNVGTDMAVCALMVWSGYFVYRRKLIAAGLLFSLAASARHEFIIFLPLAFLYLKSFRWSFLLPALSALVLDLALIGLPETTFNPAFKYLSDDYKTDLLPAHVDLDTLQGNALYHCWDQISSAYPTIFHIVTHAPLATVKIFGRDLVRSMRDLFSVWTLAPLAFFALLNLFKREASRELKFLLLIMLGHSLLLTAFTVYSERYYLLIVVEISLLGVYSLLRMPRGALVSLLLIPSFLLQLTESHDAILGDLSYSGDRYLYYRDLVPPKATLLSTHAVSAIVAGCNWMYFSNRIKDLPQYCHKNNIDFIEWGNMERIICPNWANKLNNPNDAMPEFICINKSPKAGNLYLVNGPNVQMIPQDSLKNLISGLP